MPLLFSHKEISCMKVEMAILQKKDRLTRAMKPFFVDERWVSRIEKLTKGRIYKVQKEEEEMTTPPRRRGRRRISEE